MTYNEWLKTQSSAFQDEALGKRKGAQYRAGKLKVDRYVEHGKPLTLEELEATHDKSLGETHD